MKRSFQTALVAAALGVPGGVDAKDRYGITLGVGVIGAADADPARAFSRGDEVPYCESDIAQPCATGSDPALQRARPR